METDFNLTNRINVFQLNFTTRQDRNRTKHPLAEGYNVTSLKAKEQLNDKMGCSGSFKVFTDR